MFLGGEATPASAPYAPPTPSWQQQFNNVLLRGNWFNLFYAFPNSLFFSH